MMQLSVAERLLALALSGMRPAPKIVAELYRELGDDIAWIAAEEHEMTGHVAHKLVDAGLDVPPRWAEAHDAIARRTALYLDELDRVANLFACHGVQLVALKNAGIARGIFRCLGCSPMGDIDVLVRRSDFVTAHRLLIANGYTCASRYPLKQDCFEEGCLSGGTEYRRILESAGEFWFELQWRPVAGRWLRPHQEPDVDELMARSVAVPSTTIRLLSPEDNLLQVCLHTAKLSFVRAPGFRLHSDVDRIVRGTAINWASFVRSAERLEVRTAVYLSLAIPAELLSTPVPAPVLAQLRPRSRKEVALRKSIAVAGLFHPRARKFGNGAYVRFVAMLYDNRSGLLRAIVPDSAWMKRQYRFKSSALLPVYHARRWWDLAFRRVGI
jgi:hypothetical protein